MANTTNSDLNRIEGKRLADLNDQFNRRDDRNIFKRPNSGLTYDKIAAPCYRCCGQGGSDAWKHTGFTCYRCAGSRTDPSYKEVKFKGEATPEFVAFAIGRHEADIVRKAARDAAKVAKETARVKAWNDAMEASAPGYMKAREEFGGFVAEMITRCRAKSWAMSPKQVSCVAREIDKVAERQVQDAADAEAKAGSNWLGEAGERLRAVILEYTGEFHFDNEWGRTYVMSYLTPAGDIVKWFTSNPGEEVNEPGNRFLADFTVKSHDNYRGGKETKISRATLKALPGSIPSRLTVDKDGNKWRIAFVDETVVGGLPTRKAALEIVPRLASLRNA